MRKLSEPVIVCGRLGVATNQLPLSLGLGVSLGWGWDKVGLESTNMTNTDYRHQSCNHLTQGMKEDGCKWEILQMQTNGYSNVCTINSK